MKGNQAIHASGEDYLETIYLIHKRRGYVRSVDLAEQMGYSKASISVAMKNLSELGYVRMNSEKYIVLTESGCQLAQKVYEKHQILTLLLISLGVPPTMAENDACRLEHHISDECFQYVKNYAQQYLKQT